MSLPAPEDRPDLVLAGCTASGKSAVAMELARRWDAVILSVDSMQVYRGFDVGTAKPTAADLAEIPHEFIDVLEPTCQADAAWFRELAIQRCRHHHSQGRRVIACGGTGFYYRAWFQGLGEAPPSDPQLRQQLEQLPLDSLREELRQHDPETHQTIDLQNPHRILRAVEVLRLSGRPFSEFRPPRQDPSEFPPCWVLERPPEDLRQRIDSRIEAMFKAGWIEETRLLLDGGCPPDAPAMRALGYRQIANALLAGHAPRSTLPEIQLQTWRYARRQKTWFRNQLPHFALEVPPESTTSDLVDRILS